MKTNVYSLQESFDFLLGHTRGAELAAKMECDTFSQNLNSIASAVVIAAEVHVKKIREFAERTKNVELQALLDEKIVSSVL